MILPPDKLGDLIKQLNRDSINIKEQILDICYFMQGGVDFNDAWCMSFEDRELAIKSINKRLKEKNPGSKEYM